MCSLMGISKIFKDKPKDEDASLPERQGKKKGKTSKKEDKLNDARQQASQDRHSEDEDRILAGLSPAAKLARQHTLRSKAEIAAKEAGGEGSPDRGRHECC